MALVDVGGLVAMYSIETRSAFNTSTIDADLEKVAVVFSCPKSGTIDTVSFVVPTLTTSGVLDITIETVNVGNGIPTGADYGGSAVVSYNVTTTGAHEATMGTSATATRGDIIAVVFERPTSGTFDGDIRMATTAIYAWPKTWRYFTSWGVLNRAPTLCLGYSDGSYAYPQASTHICENTSMHAADLRDMSDTLEEVGFKWTPQFSCRVTGVGFLIDETGTTADEWNGRVLDSGDSELATFTNDDTISSNGFGGAVDDWAMMTLSSALELTAGSVYRFVFEHQSGTGNNIRVLGGILPDAKYRANIGFGDKFEGTRRAGKTGAWSDEPTEIPNVVIYVDQLDDGAGGGASPGSLMQGGMQ